MNKEEMRKKFNENVKYLERNIPPDDIYLFSEQTLMATFFFMKKWSDWVSVNEEMEKCPITKKWVTNILSLMDMRDRGIELNIDLNMDSIEE